MATTVTYPVVRKLASNANYFTLLDEDVYYSLAGAKSFTIEDEEVYTQDNYRDELSSGFAGGPAAALAVTESTGGGNFELPKNNAIIIQSDSYTHTAPRNEKRKRTMMYFWDDIAATGNVVACCDYSRFDQFSPGVPKQY